MDLSNPIQAISDLGEQVGLTAAEIEKATKRISLAFASIMSNGDSKPLPDSSRIFSGLGKNLADNPMLVAWGLKIAAHTNDEVFKKFIDNFLLGTVLERKPIVKAMAKELGYHPPSTLIINPTMRCSLRCQGCYAYSFGQKTDMDRSLIEKVLNEAREFGIQFITVTGGEPFLYPELEELFASFPDINFMVYTNAQEIDSARAKRLAELGNVWPAISVEGFEKETDQRRGPGVYHKILEVMGELKRNGVMFGISTVPTRHNTELLASDEFIDHYIEQGALFGWVFTYMPVGKNPDPSLMATPQQRELLRQTSLNWRKTKPIFMADFWNDGPLCGGCMSASRYAFITNEGWVQPCVFVHYATHNVKDHSLRQIFDSRFFANIRSRQPYHPNLLRPCKVIDHPHVLAEVVAESDARPTYPGAETILTDPAIRKHLENYSAEYAKIAERSWASKDYESGHSVQVPFYGRIDLYEVYDWLFENAHKQVENQVSEPPGQEDRRPDYHKPLIKN